MPKQARRAAKFHGYAPRLPVPPTKHITFTCEDERHGVDISMGMTASEISAIICAKVNAYEVQIMDERGHKPQLGYRHLKANGKLRVTKMDISGLPVQESAQKQKSRELLAKVVETWEVEDTGKIWPSIMAPSRVDTEGKDVIMEGEEWGKEFVKTLYMLSRMVANHADAIGLVEEEIQRRIDDTSDKGAGRKGVILKDLKRVVEAIRKGREKSKAMQDELWVGKTQEAIERVEEDMDIAGVEEDVEKTEWALVLR
ncbi:hypothetical protein ACN47E_007172 [Coniothyrium glycines]